MREGAVALRSWGPGCAARSGGRGSTCDGQVALRGAEEGAVAVRSGERCKDRRKGSGCEEQGALRGAEEGAAASAARRSSGARSCERRRGGAKSSGTFRSCDRRSCGTRRLGEGGELHVFTRGQ